MKILVINCGSSSLKYQLIDMDTKEVLAKGLAERIGIDGSVLTHSPAGKDKKVFEQPMKDHKDAMSILLSALVDKECGVISDMGEISAVGHRVVHAGEKYSKSVKIDAGVMAALKECIPLAPLHNPANITGIEACEEILPNIPMVAVFDTAFHQTMPKEAFMYPLPYEYYEKYGVRKYGFHGTSHKYVSQKASELLGKDLKDLKIVTCHLGNGSSVSAIKNGKCIENSMGFTPLDGLAMGTRSGSVDPAVVKFICDTEGKTVADVDNILNKKSGVLGISGVSSDFRDLEDEAEKGNERAKLALDVFCYRVVSTVGAYVAAMNGVDAVVFTAGVGENSVTVRKMILDRLTYLGIELDEKANNNRGKDMIISKEGSSTVAMIVPTNEELMIAIDTLELVK